MSAATDAVNAIRRIIRGDLGDLRNHIENNELDEAQGALDNVIHKLDRIIGELE